MTQIPARKHGGSRNFKAFWCWPHSSSAPFKPVRHPFSLPPPWRLWRPPLIACHLTGTGKQFFIPSCCDFRVGRLMEHGNLGKSFVAKCRWIFWKLSSRQVTSHVVNRKHGRFCLEFVFRILSAPSKWMYFSDPVNWAAGQKRLGHRIAGILDTGEAKFDGADNNFPD